MVDVLAVAMYDSFTGGGLLAGDIDFYLECASRLADRFGAMARVPVAF
ncbi:MAG: hypothetical protein R3D25_17860 [Geminicoccaceae bacterium]